MGLRLMVYDRTCTVHPLETRLGAWRAPFGLTHSWQIGGNLYAGLGRLDRFAGAATWAEALEWLGTVGGDAPVLEVQFWGHGNRGLAKIGAEPLDARALAPGHRLRPALERVRDRMLPDGRWWFRTCDTFGARRGVDFAQRFTEFMGCSAAGHTHVIGPWQSGLHQLAPGAEPHWSLWEGVADGTPEHPGRSVWSAPWLPNTITCLHGAVPDGW